MKKRFTNPITRLRVRQQFMLLVIVMLCPMIFLNGFGNSKAEKLLKQQVTDAYLELNKQNHYVIDRDVDTINRVMTTIIQHPLIQQMIPSAADSVVDRLDKYQDLDKLLLSYSLGVNGGDAVSYSFFVYDPDDLYSFVPKVPLSGSKKSGIYYFSDQDKPAWFDEAVQKRGKGTLRVIPQFNNTFSKTNTLVYIRAVNNISRGNNVIGVLVATNLDKKIAASFGTVSIPDGEMYLTDPNGRILAASGAPLGGKLEVPDAFRGELPVDQAEITSDHIFVKSRSPVEEENLVYKIPLKSMLRQQTELKSVIWFISVAYIIFGIVVMMYFWRSLMTPMQKLAFFVRSYEPGNAVPKAPEEQRADEVGVLIHSVYDMAERLNVLIHDKYQLDIKQKEAQLQILYEQINPHLLYNTLESIYWKSSLEGNFESAEMIKDLSKLMRISLSKGRELITLEQEIEHATAYINLQQKRYDYSFRVTWDIDRELLAASVPKIILQPLIENAIIHGVRNMGEDGEIAVSVQSAGGCVQVRVRDNGYKEVDFAALERLLNGEKGDPSLGYGIRNIHQRIRLHFGKEYGLHYERGGEGGITAVVVLPLPSEQQEERGDDSHVQHFAG